MHAFAGGRQFGIKLEGNLVLKNKIVFVTVSQTLLATPYRERPEQNCTKL